jgi:hypothetical protein
VNSFGLSQFKAHIVSEWYCKQSGETSGPFTLDELEFLKDRGRLDPTDDVRNGTQGQWQPAGNVVSFPATGSAAAASHKARALSQPRPTPSPAPVATGGALAAAATVGLADGADGNGPVEPPSRPPQLTGADADVAAKRRKVITGICAGTGVALLILLLLLLLLSARDRLGNSGGASGNGTNVAGTSSGDGAGDGSESGDESNAGNSDQEQSGAPGVGGGSGAPDQGGDKPEPAGDEIPSIPDVPSLSLAGTQDGKSKGTGNGGTGGLGFGAGGGGGGSGVDFFGVKGKGNKFVYVVDCSGSMTGRRFEKACGELKRSIGALKPRQKFYVYFFSSGTYQMFYPTQGEEKLIRASPENVRKVTEWIDKFQEGGGGTQPKDSMLRALKLQPDTIFFLTDGAFDGRVVADIRDNNKDKKTCINTIGFETHAGEVNLIPIANQNRGDYRFVP